MKSEYNECYECFKKLGNKPKNCRKCGCSLCKKCYGIYHGLCSVCREKEIHDL